MINNIRTFYIYKYANSQNGKIYIGQTIDVHSRHKAHKSAALAGETGCPLFYRAIRKYGFEIFTFEILCNASSQKEADELEKFWINEFNSTNNDIGYNISPGGGGRANPNNTDTHKQCPRCDEIKSRKDDFSVNNNQHDKVNYICKTCTSKEQREKYAAMSQEEKETLNAERRAEYAEDIEKSRREAREYSAKNKDRIYTGQRKRREKIKAENPEKYQEIQQKNRNFYLENQEEAKQNAKAARKQYKELNSKLTPEEIYARTPLKICKDCNEKVPSNLFYIDLSASNGLGKLCREHFKERCRKRKEEKNLKQSDAL
jgi:group I intron endonuclease